jgi:type II secretory pathway predicted ATPase ExeA
MIRPAEALRHRIDGGFRLKPFDLEETPGYVEHHLCVAAFQGELSGDVFISGVYDHTEGVAR